jgi:hypothetical protein
MIISIIKQINRKLFIPAVIALALAFICFKPARSMDAAEAVSWSNNCLNQCFDPSGEVKLKKWQISVTEDLFVRLRETYQNGKQQYYSFRIKRFNDLVYLGTASAGTLLLKTDTDNIIEQTYNDPKGDEDNMAQAVSIPVKNMEPERLDSLRTALIYLRNGK